MKRVLAFVVPFAVVFGIGVGASAYLDRVSSYGPDGVPTAVAFDEIDGTQRVIEVEGMAHYETVVNQRIPGSIFREEKLYYVYGLFAPYDTKSRAIRVLIRTDREPERMVSYEMMRVTGRISAVSPDKIPFDVEIMLGKQSDYWFHDDIVLLEPTAFAEVPEP